MRSLVESGLKKAQEEKVDFMLAVGGGSTIDTAKGIALGLANDGNYWQFYNGVMAEKMIPVGTIHTISAAGSETSGSSVLVDDMETKKKFGFMNPACRPVFAIMNPELTYSVSKYQTGAGTADIFAHTYMRYLTPDASFLGDQYCVGTLKTVVKYGPIAVNDPKNYEARAELMLTSTLAMSGLVGMDRITCLNAHSLGEDFGGLYDLTHGATLAIVEPALLTYKVEAYLPRLVRFAKEVWGVSGEDDKAVALEGIERMKQFFRSMGVPVTFREVGIDIDKDGRMLAQRIEAFEGGSVYVDLSHEDVYQVYSLAK